MNFCPTQFSLFFLLAECSFVLVITHMFVSKYKKLSFCLVSWLCNGGGVAMASSESSGSSKDLDLTPTWAVACVCTVFILISITLEKSIHKLGTVCYQFQTFCFCFVLFSPYFCVLIIITVLCVSQ